MLLLKVLEMRLKDEKKERAILENEFNTLQKQLQQAKKKSVGWFSCNYWGHESHALRYDPVISSSGYSRVVVVSFDYDFSYFVLYLVAEESADRIATLTAHDDAVREKEKEELKALKQEVVKLRQNGLELKHQVESSEAQIKDQEVSKKMNNSINLLRLNHLRIEL
jgi:hypothetical protein